MRLAYVDVSEALVETHRLVQDQEEGLLVNFGDNYFCGCGKHSNLREEVCDNLNIPILRANYLGGTIVIFPGDLSIMEVKRGHSTFGAKTIQCLCDYLRSKGLPVFVDNNDLLLSDVDNRVAYKVASYGSNWVGAMTETGIHVSINTDVELIKSICVKPMVKVPGALGQYGITAQELWQAILAILEYDVEEEGDG